MTRAEWLEEHSAGEGDVQVDEFGEFLITHDESDHSDGFQVDIGKLYLPIGEFTDLT